MCSRDRYNICRNDGSIEVMVHFSLYRDEGNVPLQSGLYRPIKLTPKLASDVEIVAQFTSVTITHLEAIRARYNVSYDHGEILI